ncbi:MAG: hypothetical protein WAO07_19455, partial [Desulfobacterales bacterium]
RRSATSVASLSARMAITGRWRFGGRIASIVWACSNVATAVAGGLCTGYFSGPKAIEALPKRSKNVAPMPMEMVRKFMSVAYHCK